MLSNLATALFEHGRITTTETRARMLRPLAEKLITKAKRGRPAQPSRGHQDDPRQVGRPHAVHRDRADLLGASRWLHPHHQDRPPQGRQRPHGGHRAGDRGVQPQGSLDQEDQRCCRSGAGCRGDRGRRDRGPPPPRSTRLPLPSTRPLPPSTRLPPRSTRLLPRSTRLPPRRPRTSPRPDPRVITRPVTPLGWRASCACAATGRWVRRIRAGEDPPHAPLRDGQGPRRHRGCAGSRRRTPVRGSLRRRPR